MELLNAAESGDLARVRKLLAGAGKSRVDNRGPRKTTALQVAAIGGHVEIVRALLEAGANPDLQDADSQTALMHAICAPAQDIVDTLLDAGARADLEDWIALDFAVRFGELPMVKRLLELGAPPNRCDKESGMTVLMEAVMRGNVEMVEALLDAGANRELKNTSGQTAAAFAAYAKNHALLELLRGETPSDGSELIAAVTAGDIAQVQKLLDEKIDVNYAEPMFGNTPLHQAVYKANTKLIELLLKAGATIDARDANGRTPLSAAVMDGRASVVKQLIKSGANPNISDGYGDIALAEAVSLGRNAVVDVLLQSGADPNKSTDRSPAPILWAVQVGTPALVKKLIAAGADPNATLRQPRSIHFDGFAVGTTALMFAARDGSKDIVKLLLEEGADPTTANSNGETAADFATKKGHKSVLELLQKSGATVDMKSKTLHSAALLTAAEKGDLEALQSAIAAGADVNVAREDDESTPLIFASLNGNVESARALIAAGADVNRSTPWGLGPLRCAVVRGHAGVVKLLLDSGANPNITYAPASVPAEARNTVYSSLESPLVDAAFSGHEHIIDLLLAAGADLNPDAEGITNVVTAALGGRRFELAHKLIRMGAKTKKDDEVYLTMLSWADLASTPDFQLSTADVANTFNVTAEKFDAAPGTWLFQVKGPEEEVTERITKHFDELYEKAAKRNHTIIDVGQAYGCGPHTRYFVLFPTRDMFAIMGAFGVYGNDVELSNRDLIKWFRALHKVEPFTLRGCRRDTVTIEFDRLIADPKGWAKKMLAFCPDLMADGDTKDFIAKLRTQRRIEFWWD
jgi:ankyrin repeat protein